MARRGAVKRRWWSDLPADLLAAIHLRCYSTYDRARFAAVCRSWRAAASWHPARPPLPLLFSWTGDRKRDRNIRAYSPVDGRALRVVLPKVLRGKKFVGSYDGGWVAATSRRERDTQLLIANLFSTRVQVALSVNQRNIVCACPDAQFEELDNARASRAPVVQVIFSDDPTSSGCILAAITKRCKLAVCRVGSPENIWTTRGCGLYRERELVDIAFCNGQLVGLTLGGDLYKYDVGQNQNGALAITLVRQIPNEAPQLDCLARYIVELRGELALVLQLNGSTFWVLQLNEAASGKILWGRVTTLDDHALFLGPHSSKLVQVSTAGRHDGRMKENHVYYLMRQQDNLAGHKERVTRLGLGSCNVYRENRGMHQCMENITSEGYHYKDDNGNGCMWLLPSKLC
uniref:KIB1-4 beta-propeller domain-containing protein n=1 Tax=Hordeum vulgare subsp. vulgare TaxID=112509 RepID=A0A8I7BAX8_HORVV